MTVSSEDAVAIPSPLAGEGQGGEYSRTMILGVPPTPNPSPQGGGEHGHGLGGAA
jgi:hypothetical protein